MSVFCAFYKEERFMRIKEYRTELDKDKKNVLCEIGYYDVTEDRFDKPEKIARFAINQLHLDRRAEEYVYGVGLTTKTQALGVFEISHGAVSASICNPREIFIRLLLCGDTNLSKADRMVAQKLKEAGDLLGITMIDNIIIGYHYYLSMKENSNAKLLNRMSI